MFNDVVLSHLWRKLSIGYRCIACTSGYIWLIACVFLVVVTQTYAVEGPKPHKKLAIKIAMNAEIVLEYKALVGDSTCERRLDFNDPRLTRGVLEIAIICRALFESGYSLIIEPISSPNYNRSLRMVEQGVAHFAAESIWSKDLSGDIDVFKSDAVIRLGEFEKGVYTLKNHPLQGMKPDDITLTLFKGATVKGWHYDWNIISSLTEKLVSAIHIVSVFKMMNIGRADFTLLEFPSTPTLMFELEGVQLYPLLGVKVTIPDQRHFIVSKRFNNSRQLLDALNRGLRILRERGEVRAMYEASGFISPRAKPWTVINKHSLSPF